MEDNNNTVDTQTTTTSVESTNEVKTFTQEQLDQVVDSRLKRTKETIAKKLGLESYSDEALESFVSEYSELGTKVSTLEETIATKENILFDKDLTVEALMSGVTKDNVAKVSKLVKSDMQDNKELDVQGALQQVLTDYPFFAQSQPDSVKPEVKVGVEVKGGTKTLNEVDEYLASNKRYKNSRYSK